MSNNNHLSDIKHLESAFIELIQKRFGLIVHVNQAQNLEKIIATTCDTFNILPQEYLNRLKNCPSNDPILQDLVVAITVGESYFFRDKHQINLLKNVLLPNLIKQREGIRTLKIWSAGCSTGEEIYTIAMLLSELIPLNLWDLYLVGTDININALRKAEAGVFGQWSMRSISENYLQRYFIKQDTNYILSPEIRRLVQFTYLNLCDNTYPSTLNKINSIDLILCRNVLIYFDIELIAEIMKKLNACMNKNAYLLLGASDPIVTKGTNLLFNHDEAIYFSLDNSVVPQKDFKQ